MSLRGRIAFVVLALIAFAPAAHALRCGNRLVNSGDFDVQVRDRCGDPYWIEDRYQLIVNNDPNLQTISQVTYTAWFYNFGSNRLLVRVLLRDGHVVREDTLGRGVDTIGDSCGPTKMNRGMSSGELVAYCGEPASRNQQPVTQIRRVAPGTYSETDSALEDWTYDLGGNFFYVLHLRNGHVESVENVRR